MMKKTEKSKNLWDEKIREYLTNFESIHYGIAVLKNDQFSTLLKANAAFYEMIGYTEEQLLEKHQNEIANILIDDICDRIEIHPIVKDLENTFDLRIRTEDQTVRWVHGFTSYNEQLDVFFLTIADITEQKLLDDKVAMKTTLNNCIEALFEVGVTDKTAEESYFDILNQLKEYYQSDITFFYRFKNGTYEVENIYEVFADDVEPSKHTFPITVPEHHIKLLQKLSDARTDEYKSLVNSLDTNETTSLKNLHAQHNVVDFACVSVNDKDGKIAACMGVTNPKSHEDDKELMQLLSRFVCMFIEHQQDQHIKNEAISLEETAKQNLVEKCIVNSQNLTHADESVSDTLDALCLHYDADFAVALLNQEDGYCITSYVGGRKVPDLDGLDNQPRHVMEQWVEVFAKYPEVVSDTDLVDPIAVMVKQLLKDKYGINNFIVSPLKESNGTVKGLLFVNNFKLMNRGRSMVHFVAESISSYLNKIELYENTQLNLLTRLANKKTIENQISQLLDEGKNGTLFVVDIDDFKQLNESFGHHIGDQTIVDLGDSLKDIFESTDIVGRFGGDKFMVFSTKIVSYDLVIAKAKQILAKTYHRYEKDGISMDISSSIGICIVTDKNRKFHLLNENANYALYVAKKNGKHRYHIYTDSEYFGDTSLADEMQFYPNVVEKLQAAIHERSFVVHYQPIYHVPTGTYTQAEALVRIAKPDGNLIYPNDFIEVAENSGLIVEMTYQILDQVCSDFREILKESPNTTLKSIAINIPYLQFTDPNMENRFLEILAKNYIAPSQIKLEITERSVVSDMELMLRKMNSLKALGFDFELDDFGTDYSNLKMCVSLPLEIIKLDRSLLLAAMASNEDCRFFEHILLALHDSGRNAVMEGVETQEQLDWATACKCEYIQGYYFSKPIDFRAFSKLLLSEKMELSTKVATNKTSDINNKLKEYLDDYENFPCGVAVIDNDENATLLRANPNFYKTIGYTEKEFSENHKNCMKDILVDDFFDTLQKRTKSKDYSAEWDIRIRTSAGDVRWVHDIAHYNAKMNLFFVVFVDITDKMISASTDLSYTAFQTKNEILLYLNKYLSKHFVVTDLVTDEIVYMSPSAMQESGFKRESDWCGKTYIELGFGSKENVRSDYFEPLNEDEFTIHEYYNEYHKKYIRTESKIINIPKIHRKLRLSIINDITAQKQLERKMEAQNSLRYCIETLFTAGTTDKESKDAYVGILNELKKYYRADRAFFYKFKDGTYEIENFIQISPDGMKKIEIPPQMRANENHIKLMREFSKKSIVNSQDVLDMLEGEDKTRLEEAYLEYNIKTFDCVAIKNTKDDIVAFMGVTNPQYYKDSRTLMEMLSRYIFMFIEHEQNDNAKDEALKLEMISKKKLIETRAKDFHYLTNSKANITNTLNALCEHYDADFAVIISRFEDNTYGISHVGGSNVPDLVELKQVKGFMKNWLEIFKNHTEFASDIDFDDASAPVIKKMLREKFGINNFVASPMRGVNNEFMGLLIVNNIRFTYRSHLLVHIIANDISDYLQKIELNEKNNLEPLSKLYNKVATQNQITSLLEVEKTGTLFIIDIDNFKCLNDTLGHQMGDQGIIDFASVLKGLFRDTDVIGRIGGDEFMVFCPSLNSEDSIKKKANSILEKCNLKYEKEENKVEISASVGICSVNYNCNTFENLYDRADRALYISKQNGKNQYNIYSKEINK